MNPVHVIDYENYRLGTTQPLCEQHLKQLVRLFQSPGRNAGNPLDGRLPVSKSHLQGIGPIVVKHYRRGGALAHLIKKSYLNSGIARCRVEFEQMRAANSIGIRTPEPIAYAFRGFLFYQAWLVTKEIANPRSLAQLSLSDPQRAAVAMSGLIPQIKLMIDHGILHADFHPGNILIDSGNRIFLIDFDKARPFTGSKDRLRKILLKRWQRAIEKHGLPPMLCDSLRANI